MHLVLFGHHPYVSYYIEAQTISSFYNTSGIAATREREREREKERERENERERERERRREQVHTRQGNCKFFKVREFYVV